MADGALDAAVSTHERLLSLPSAPEPIRVAALRQLGRAAFNAEELDAAARWFEAAVDLTTQGHPDLAVASLLDQVFQTWAHLGPGSALPLAVRARKLAASAQASLRSSADAAWALCAHLLGDGRGMEIAEQAAENASAARTSLLGDVHWVLDPACVPGDIAVWAERFALAERLFADILAAAEQRCEPFIIFHASFSWADGLCRLGRLGESLAFAERAIEAAELVPITLPLATAGKALTLLEMGRLQEAAALSEQLEAMHAGGHPWYLVTGFGERLRGTLALRRGEVETACESFVRLEELAASWGLRDPCHIPWAADAISAYLMAGRDADASRVVEWLELQTSLSARWPGVIAAIGRAALAERGGDASLAEVNFKHALAIQHALRLARARTLIEYGAFLCRRGDLRRARPILAQALQIADACGAGWYSDQARVLWRRAGGRARGHDTRGLTPQEAAIAQLVRVGRSNREIAQQLFVSVNTVETHLRHIYGKLGIGRRWELIARDDLGAGIDATIGR
jgi:DNA-binding CsgD family transcriptional regulator